MRHVTYIPLACLAQEPRAVELIAGGAAAAAAAAATAGAAAAAAAGGAAAAAAAVVGIGVVVVALAAAARAPACKSIYVTQGEVGRRLGFEFEWKQPLAADNLERSRGEKVGRQMDYLLHTAIPAAV